MVALIVVLGRLFHNLNTLNASFAKLGYLAREDVKRYFDEASDQAVDMYRRSAAENQRIVEASMQRVLAQSGQTMRTTLVQAERDAAGIILKANQDARNIVADAQRSSQTYLDQLVDRATEAIEWSMEQYLKEQFSLEQHEDMVKHLITVYLDEHKRS